MLFAEQADKSLIASVQVKSTWARDFFCPGCCNEVHYVSAHERSSESGDTFVSSHFRHSPNDRAECDYPDDANHTPESDFHARMVVIGLEGLKSRCKNGPAEVASVLPAYVNEDFDTGTRTGGSRTKAIGGHYPDAYIEFAEPDPVYGSGVVLEAQYKNHKKEIKTTTHDYHDAGYSVVWTHPQNYGGAYGVELPEILSATMDYPFYDEYIVAQANGNLWPGTEADNILNELPDEFTLSILSDGPLDGEAGLCFRWNWSRYDRKYPSTPGLNVTPRSTSQQTHSKSEWERGRWPVKASSLSDDSDCEGCGRRGTFHITSASDEFRYDLKLCKVCLERIADMVKLLKQENSHDRSIIRRGLEYVPQIARREISALPDDELLNYYAQYRGKVGEEIPRPPPVRRR